MIPFGSKEVPAAKRLKHKSIKFGLLPTVCAFEHRVFENELMRIESTKHYT